MIGVVVPAHNEQALLGDCLEALLCAADDAGEEVRILVVLDACTDRSREIARACGVQTLAIDAGNVGYARHAGAAHLLDQGVRWLACTDADSRVPRNWLRQQLAFNADAVCGTVSIEEWDPQHSAEVRQRYQNLYQPGEGHRHIHGANLGVCAQAYRRVGGFRPLAVHEDRYLIEDLQRSGASIVWTALNGVRTSSRLDCRARGGFGDYLKALAQEH